MEKVYRQKGMTQTLKVVFTALTLYAVYLPIAVWTKSNYVPQAEPEGAIVERLYAIQHVHRYSYRVPTFALGGYADRDISSQNSPVVLYEDLVPLRPGRSTRINVEEVGSGHFYHTIVKNGSKDVPTVTFSTSDNSNPLRNGRTYWAVLPK